MATHTGRETLRQPSVPAWSPSAHLAGSLTPTASPCSSGHATEKINKRRGPQEPLTTSSAKKRMRKQNFTKWQGTWGEKMGKNGELANSMLASASAPSSRFSPRPHSDLKADLKLARSVSVAPASPKSARADTKSRPVRQTLRLRSRSATRLTEAQWLSFKRRQSQMSLQVEPIAPQEAVPAALTIHPVVPPSVEPFILLFRHQWSRWSRQRPRLAR